MDTLQGPVTDLRFFNFPTISEKSTNFSLQSSLSFSVQSPYQIQIQVIKLGNVKYDQITYEKSDSNKWIHYTVLRKNNEICLFENYDFLATFSPNTFSHLTVIATEKINWKIHQYPLRTANHISKKPTILRISPKNSYLILYAYLCPHCYLEVHLPRKQKRIIDKTISNFPELWKPQKLYINDASNITLVRGTKNGRYDGYWGIDIRAFDKDSEKEEDLGISENVSPTNTCGCDFFKNFIVECEDCNIAPRVEFTHYEFENFMLAVYWKLNKNCKIKQFIVRFQNKRYTTSNFSYFFENLDACTNYTIGVAVRIGNNGIGEEVNKTIETKIDVETQYFGHESFALKNRFIAFDETESTYKKVLPCLTHDERTNFGQTFLYSSLDLPWSACTNYVASTKIKTMRMKYIVKSLHPHPFKLAFIGLSETYANLTFQLDADKETKLILLCKFDIDLKSRFEDGKNDIEFYYHNLIPVESLTWTDFTRNFGGKPPDNAFQISKYETDLYRFSFPTPFASTDRHAFFNIFVKVLPVKCCHNETHTYIVIVTHEFFHNTPLKNFEVCYTETNKTVCTKTTQTATDLFLKPLRQYSIRISVATRNFTSPFFSLPSLRTSSGVPVLYDSLTAPTKNGTTMNFTLWKKTFSEVNGEIVAYALILLTEEVEPPTDYGFWNGSNETWPSIPERSKQLTPNFWNPFKNLSRRHFFFIIGSGEVDSNPPLEDNKDYWLVVRALTDAGYKDSRLLHFKTEFIESDVLESNLKENEATDSNLYYVIYGLIIFSLLVISMSICILYLYLQRKRTTTTFGNEAETKYLLCELDMFRGIEVKQFDQFLTEEFCSRIKQEFDTFDVKITQPLTIALQASNIDKNRKQEEYLPYDCNRVILRHLAGVGRGNYINASYIDGYNRTKAYIAAQGPKFKTVKSFWRMIWQENIEIIIMVSNTFENKERMCAEYWPPKENAIYECGRMVITSLSQNIFDCYTRRQLQVSYGGSKRLITQFQIKWVFDSERYFPNHLLPAIKFLQKNDRMCSPILVHSGYGVGRTGVIILCDLALQMIKDKGKVDFYNLTQNLKHQRLFLVKEFEHYALAHFTVKEFLMDQENPFNESVDNQSCKQQLEYLDILCEHDTMLQKLTPKAESKWEQNLVVSALRYGCDGKFLVLQEPTMENFAPFWVMVAHESIEVITFLNKRVPFQSHLYRGAKEVIELTFVKTSRTSYCSVLKFSLLIYDAVTKEIIDERTVSVLEFNEWKQKKLVPNSIEHFVELVDGISQIIPPKPTLILCSDGCTASGLFVVASYVIEQFKSEAEIDVCSAVRVARRSGRKFVDSEKQLKFVYKCVTEFCKNIDNYQTIDFL